MNMNLDPHIPPERPTTWRRKFSNPPPIFDFIFGIVVPILCLYFDPVVFYDKVPCSNTPLPLAPYQIFMYIAMGLGMIILAIWLVVGNKITHGLGLIAGVFFVGTALAATIGIVLLPMSLPGLLICLGVLGFIPFLTAYVYFRNGIRTVLRARQQNPSRSSTRLIAAILTGALLILCIPAFLQWQAPRLFPQWQAAPQYADTCAGE